MICPKCEKDIPIIDSNHSLWIAYMCKKCKIIVLQIREKYKKEYLIPLWNGKDLCIGEPYGKEL